MFADVIRRIAPKRAMVFAHREELIWQAQSTIEATTGLKCEIEMGDYKARGWASPLPKCPVVISTVQTQIGGRMGRFDPFDFAVLIIDEAHHATSPTYRRLIDYYRQNPALKVLGLTATPDRSDREALGQVFQTVAFDYEILDAIHDGWLVPVDQQMVSVMGLDYSRIRTQAGDLHGADLATVMESESNLHGIASASIEIIAQRRSLVFTASVRHASMLAEIFNRHRPGMAGWVSGKTPKVERRKLLADFASGQIQIVCNCGVLTEGFDDAGLEVIIMGRPTKSRSLYAQMVGRSTRPLPGLVDGPPTPQERKAAIAASAKPACLVVDFVGNSGRHKLITSADILGGRVSPQAIAQATAYAKKVGKPVCMSKLLDEEERKVIAAEQAKRKARELSEEARRARLIVAAEWTATPIDPFDTFQLQPAQSSWDFGRSLTEKEKDLLARHLDLNPLTIPYAQAKQLCIEVCRRLNGGLCSLKQADWLKRHGYPIETTRKEAHKIMNRWKLNGWRRPPDTYDPEAE